MVRLKSPKDRPMTMSMNELTTAMATDRQDSTDNDMIENTSSEPSSRWTPTLDARGQVQRFDVYEAEIFRFALANAGGCVSRAAELLGVGRATMYRKMRAYKIVAPPVSERAIDRSRKAPAQSGAESDRAA
jgi:transcriptional regulator of acetoin/glycerol metabolism